MGLTKDQQNAFESMDSGANVFLTGKAGTGKSYLLEHFIKEKEKEGKAILVTASTGIAAININGATVHRTFKVPLDLPSIARGPSIKRKDSLLKVSDIVIIDEVSMLRLDIFEYIMKMIYHSNEDIQVILTGDFLQLDPVLTSNDKPVYQKIYGHLNTFCFQSSLWTKRDFQTIELTEVIRQDNNSVLVENLNKARVGDLSCIKYFNQFVNNEIEEEEAISICGTNKKAFEINKQKTEQLDTPYKVKEADIKGEVQTSDMPTDEKLYLKEGCRVMTLINDEEEGYYNGSLGTIDHIGYDVVGIDLDNGNHVDVERHTYDIKKYVTKEETYYIDESTNKEVSKEIAEKYKNKDSDFFESLLNDSDDKKKKIKEKKRKAIKLKKIGSFTQFPIKVAFAITIHKSQGQTFENLKIYPQSWSYGQLYVALSRCKNEKGLSLASPIMPNFLKANPSVVDFYYNPDYFKKIQNAKNNIVKKQVVSLNKNLKNIDIKDYDDMVKKTSTSNVKVPVKYKDFIKKMLVLFHDVYDTDEKEGNND